MVFLLDGDAWMERGGTWIAGGSDAEFVIAGDAESPLHVFLRNGPVDNTVTIRSAAWEQRLVPTPGEERLVNLPPTGSGRPTPLTVAATNGFRPAHVNRSSDDWRFLGVWVEIR